MENNIEDLIEESKKVEEEVDKTMDSYVDKLTIIKLKQKLEMYEEFLKIRSSEIKELVTIIINKPETEKNEKIEKIGDMIIDLLSNLELPCRH
jgi:hypothetical protein